MDGSPPVAAALKTSDSPSTPSAPRPGDEHHQRLREAIEHAAHYLPAQGPISVFIHHNTLHAFEDLPFDEGVQKGAALFGCQPYLSEDRYHELLDQERIREADLAAVLLDDLGDSADELLGFMGTRYQLRLKMLKYRLRIAPAAELQWFVAESDALRKFRADAPPVIRRRFVAEMRHWVMRHRRNGGWIESSPVRDKGIRHIQQALGGLIDELGRHNLERWTEAAWEAFALKALWRVCRTGMHGLKKPAPAPRPGLRHRDLLRDATGADSDALVHDVLVGFCAAFLDQGFAHWTLPNRQQGFFRSFSALYRNSGGPPDRWMRGLAAELIRLDEARLTPLDSIQESLRMLGVPEPEWGPYLTATLLALRGWGGMIRQVEIRSDSVAHAIPPGSLVEFLAVRLILDRLAVAYVAREQLGFRGPLSELRGQLAAPPSRSEAAMIEQRALLVFQLAQVLGWLPVELGNLSKDEWSRLVSEIEAFGPMERRRVLHAAFERRYRVDALDALAIRSREPAPSLQRPRWQVFTCLDEREESFRRHLEEVAPQVETFGAAGFYNVAIYYRGAADAHFVPLCPIVIKPKHWVEESVAYTEELTHDRRAKARRALGMASHRMHLGSRNFVLGALLAGLGAVATIPLAARVLFPRLTARLRRRVGRWVQPPSQTQLLLERKSGAPAPEIDGFGFTLDEMADMAARFLRDNGLTSRFARIVLILGHGSNSLNNPHNSAYNCGACGGSAGGPNARAMAQILNDPRIRRRLAERELILPDDTYVVGGWHDTCNDVVTYFDLGRLPKSHQQEFSELRKNVEEALDRNAHERCRRFQSAPLTLSFTAARRHVEARSEDLAQTRPECGHASNALCIVGRRERNRGLFLDRRAFLTSYDPTQDDAEHNILHGLLQAVFPVCGGISLEYYFSYVDNVGFGCGTKLPHNVTSLLGIMDGAASDLRTGLPWQMVEIHEPMRLLIVVETTPAAMLSIMDRNPAIARLCRNGWVQLATLAPDSAEIQFFNRGQFEPYCPEAAQLPTARSSTDWYRGWRENLGFATIRASSSGT